MTQFNTDVFVRDFKNRIAALEAAEKTTRTELRELGNGVLHMLHLHGNVGYLNDLLGAYMTPINRRVLILFFKEFSGFNYDESTKRFTNKIKDVEKYESIKENCLALLEDPTFDFWAWSQPLRIEPVPKAFDPKEVEKAVEKQLKKATKDGVADAEVQLLLAVLNAGISPDSLLKAMELAK